jgi:hypothetical protein
MRMTLAWQRGLSSASDACGAPRAPEGTFKTYERPAASVTGVRRNSARVAPFRGHDRDCNYRRGLRGHKGSAARRRAAVGRPDGEMRIWLDHDVVDGLRALRRPGESYSDVILRLAKGDGGEE